MGDYDKVIKENVEVIFLRFLERFTGIKITQSRVLKDKLQITLEREVDFLRMVTDQSGEEFILHLEFQTTDEREMVYRMAEYKAIIQRKYALPVRQWVCYLGEAKPKMPTALPEEMQITGFNLINIGESSAEDMLSSETPEEIILSILTGYPKSDAGRVIGSILRRLREKAGDEKQLSKAMQQLLVLSRLRNLEVEVTQKVKEMPIIYDITTDGLYNQGMEQGLEQGMKQGMEQEKTRMISGFIAQQVLTVEQIAEAAGVSVAEVLKIKSQKETE